MNKYQIGDDVRCQATFTNSDTNVPIDPTVVRFQVRPPSGAITTYTYNSDPQLTRVSTGVYRVVVDANQIGIWHYRFYSEGNGKAAGEGRFEVVPSVF
jgi:uncharacterized protein YfaS (alpha-2-macroglobulin family)